MTTLCQVVSLIALVNCRAGFQIASFFLRNSASNFSVVVRTILVPICDLATVPTIGVRICIFWLKALFIESLIFIESILAAISAVPCSIRRLSRRDIALGPCCRCCCYYCCCCCCAIGSYRASAKVFFLFWRRLGFRVGLFSWFCVGAFFCSLIGLFVGLSTSIEVFETLSRIFSILASNLSIWPCSSIVDIAIGFGGRDRDFEPISIGLASIIDSSSYSRSCISLSSMYSSPSISLSSSIAARIASLARYRYWVADILF